MIDNKQHPASFRDPAGFIFEHEAKFYRQINQVYAADFDLFKKSGLYDLLAGQKKILTHTELDQNFTGTAQWYKTLLPEQLGFVSYPYEWCFSQWKDAALLTLDLVKISISHGMILKDATPFNIQFINGTPVFIDTLSFEKYDATKPWIAYRQFTECFIAPLLLAKYNSAELLKIFQLYPDGIPLRIISKLLPLKSMFNANVFLHIRLPNLLRSKRDSPQKKPVPFTQQKLSNIISNLYSFVNALSLPSSVTQWNNYYEETILSNEYAEAKMMITENWLKELTGQTVLDIGTNTGLFAKAAAASGKFTIAIDADIACIDKLYSECRQKNIDNLIPLFVDITNPSPAIGWNNEERAAFAERVHADITMALALIHHLAIGKNISFEQIAVAFSSLAPCLIIEFVPKSDPKVQLLLQDRVDIFSTYTESFFLEIFEKKFTVIKRVVVPGTERVLFLMK
ncbi:MAG: SAM-dependent methyltransferase, partial [Bacteroidota bacterium]